MNKYNLTVLFVMFVLTTFAQEKIGTYYSSDLKQTFKIKAASASSDKPVLLLEIYGGILKDSYYLKLDQELTLFIEALSRAKAKYSEWKKIAKDNNVDFTTKLMDVSFPPVSVFWYDSFENKYTFIESLNLLPGFNVSNRTYTFRLSALSTRLENQAYSITMSNEKEFDKLISKISPEYLLNKLDQTKIEK